MNWSRRARRKGASWNRGAIDLHLYAVVAVAVISGLLLWWTNVSWRENLAAYQPMFTKMRQVRSEVVRGYLTVVRSLGGEVDIRLADVDAFFEQATGQLADIEAIMDKAGTFGPWGGDAGKARAAVAAYGRAVASFHAMLNRAVSGEDGGLVHYGLELHAAFAALENRADALHVDTQQRLLTAVMRQDRLNVLLAWLWLLFLGLLALSLSLAGIRRHRAEKAMQESEAKYRSLFEQGMDVILLVADDTGLILDCNEAVSSEWGYDREELIGRPLSFLQASGQHVPSAAPREVWYPDGRRAVLREARVRTRTGEMKDLAVKTGFFILNHRSVRLAMYRDVTDRRKSEVALLEREAMLRQLGDNLPDGMVFKLALTSGCQRRYLYVSQGVERIFGVDAASVLENAAALEATLHPDDREMLTRAECTSLNDLAVFDVQVRLWGEQRAGRWVQFRAAPRQGPDGGIVFDGVAWDITSQKRGEETLRQAKIAAEAASQAKSEFLANISHEVRTPLNGVLAMLQLLRTAPLDADSLANVETALASARGLVKILSDILDCSLLDAGRLVVRWDVVDCRVLVAEAMRFLSLECDRKGLQPALAVSGEVPRWIVTDPARLRQILFNVLGNAVKFTEKGSVRLEVDVASRVGEDVHLFFSVRDTGIGIPEERLDAIFEPFTQLDGSLTRKYGGTGLGLGIVKRLVELLHGHILVDTSPGRGTDFTFTIRCREAEPPVARPKPPVPTHEGRQTIRVLVVEDEAVNRMATVAMLKKFGYAVEAVEDGDQVVPALSRNIFDVVLMDIQMPRVNGVEATRRVRDAVVPGVDPHIPIIAVTAHALAGDRERYLQSGMDDYLSKPVDMEALSEAIARVLDHTAHTAPPGPGTSRGAA